MNNFMQSPEGKAQELQYLSESLSNRFDEQPEALKKSTDKLIKAEKICTNIEDNKLRKSDLPSHLAKSSESLEIAVRNLVRAGDLPIS